MDFENTWTLLHLLWIVPLFGILVYYASAKRKKILNKIFGDNSRNPQYSTLSRGRRYLRTWLLLAAIMLLLVAVARPRWGWRILPFSGRGRDLMIVLDVSKSMNSEDVKPSRLKHAKLFLRNLIKARSGDRFGLVAFAGSAFLDCPLTVDKTSLFQTLDETTTASIPLGGTNIENALNTAITAFQAAEGGYRAIILITDGDELHGNSSKAIAQLQKLKIPLFIVGIGDPTGDGLIKITNSDGKTVLMRDSNGELIKSRLNEIQLKKLKQEVKGSIYVRSTETNPELKPILKKIKGLVPKEYEKGNNKRPIERFHYPLFAAVLLLLIRLGVGERRKTNGNGKSTTLALLAILCLFGVSPINAQQLAKQNPAPLSLGDEIPIGPKKKVSKEDKATGIDLYNAGLKLHHKKQIEEAAKRYQQAINMSGESPEVRGKSFQNLGVISHNQARAVMGKDPDKALKIFDKTEEMYREAMRSDTHLKKVILNQQKLIDDRVLAKQIKKQKEELKKKQKEAQKKTQEALKQQQKENKEKQKKEPKKDKKKEQKQQKQQKQDQQKKQQQDQQKKQQQKQNQQKQDKQQKQKQDKQNKQQNQKQEQQKQQKQNDQKQDQDKDTEKKINDAQKAVDDLKEEAEKRKNKEVSQSADQAQKELKKAKQEHKKGDGKKSEEHIKKALDKLRQADKNNENKNKEDQGKTGKDQKDDAKKEQKDKNKDKKQQQNDRKLDKKNPMEQQQGKQDKKDKEQDIDKRQAAALLEMMANDEKNLRDAIKDQQRQNSKVRRVLKDW